MELSIQLKSVENMKDVNMVLHAGDLVSDARHLEVLNIKTYVAGNCDFYSLESTEKILEIHDKRIFNSWAYLQSKIWI